MQGYLILRNLSNNRSTSQPMNDRHAVSPLCPKRPSARGLVASFSVRLLFKSIKKTMHFTRLSLHRNATYNLNRLNRVKCIVFCGFNQ